MHHAIAKLFAKTFRSMNRMLTVKDVKIESYKFKKISLIIKNTLTVLKIVDKNIRTRRPVVARKGRCRYCPIQRYCQLLTTYCLAIIHLLRLKRRLGDDISYPRLNLTVGYTKGNKVITVDFHDSREILF